ncbi:DUF4835 domain-containing protein [Bacteroidia bacterium]|nr:DUF4835 domain-containing protein [Bacteroidia bacterium]
MYAIELNAKITVNSDRIQSTNKNVFATMERALNQLVNETKWSNASFAITEKIDCTFSLSISEQTTDNKFKGELFVQARRPVYNSSYLTSTLNFRDKNIEFEYMENANLEMTETSISNNLIATVAFYCNLILALDFDSFSNLGGSVFFRTAQNIAMQAQSNPAWTGWSAFDDNKSRSSIINAYLDEQTKPMRELSYTYHRKSLDEMAANPDRARTTILNALSVLKDIRSIQNSEIVLQMFADCKLDEIVSLAAKATAEEKKITYDLLKSVFPASSTQLEPLKK